MQAATRVQYPWGLVAFGGACAAMGIRALLTKRAVVIEKEFPDVRITIHKVRDFGLFGTIEYTWSDGDQSFSHTRFTTPNPTIYVVPASAKHAY